MPTTAVDVEVGAAVVIEYDSVALELAALSVAVVFLRYAAMLYANHLLATLSVSDVPADGRASGLDGATIERLPCFVSRGGAATAEECAVCLSTVEQGETVRALPCCTHAFHAWCVDAWLRLRATCPVCRATCR
ncbi:E3 ubiquitin-protein ligase ATL23-like [Phragmites australis]|uniref:E3 ubiquitin-protein ligase ATL23-like n=1 Tax=Phragmites australis TaxID=29695 RepID=UPI002D776F89|nr:E3 ubiquitin-protein ligase ATL23-like [Phragmites australis]